MATWRTQFTPGWYMNRELWWKEHHSHHNLHHHLHHHHMSLLPRPAAHKKALLKQRKGRLLLNQLLPLWLLPPQWNWTSVKEKELQSLHGSTRYPLISTATLAFNAFIQNLKINATSTTKTNVSQKDHLEQVDVRLEIPFLWLVDFSLYLVWGNYSLICEFSSFISDLCLS